MNVSGFTFCRNAVRYDYPLVESIRSILPIVDGARYVALAIILEDLFILAIEAPNPTLAGNNSPRLHLVAYDKAGNVIASDCGTCSGG